MKNLKVGDKIEVDVSKITVGKDNKLYITISTDWADNKPTFLVKDDRFVWESSNKSVYIK